MIPSTRRAVLENIGRNLSVVGVEPMKLVNDKPLVSKWNVAPLKANVDRLKTEADHWNSNQRSFEGRIQKHKSKTTTNNNSSDFIDLDRVRLRFLKVKDLEDSARFSDRGSLLKTEVESAESGVETESPAEALTVSYSIGYSSGLMSQNQRPNTAVATDPSLGCENPHAGAVGYGTPYEDDTSTCFTSRHPTRCSTAWSLTSGRRTTSGKQPSYGRVAGGGVGSSGGGGGRGGSGKGRRGMESDKYRRTCSNELMNVITIDDGVVDAEDDNTEPPDKCDKVLEIQATTDRNSASTKTGKRKGRVDTHRPIRSRDDLLRLIDRAMSLKISGFRRK